jgi:VWFA-related protein
VKRMRIPRLVLAFLVILSASLAGQQPAPQQPTPQPTFRVGATYVRVDAYVTQDGKPVTDLSPDDFEIYEDGVKQRIRNFELVSVPPGNLQITPRRDPQTIAEMREKIGEPRRRVFVLYVDTYHSQIGSSMAARKAFKQFVEHLVGPDDLIAGMTPEMSPEALAFGSRTEALESFLDSVWGRRDSIRQDPNEEYMQSCFETRELKGQWPIYLKRLRTKETLDSLEALVKHLGDLREERKAVVVLSEGWELYREDYSLLDRANPRGRPIHTGPVFVPPKVGGVGVQDNDNSGAPTSGMCDKILMELQNMETFQQFRDMPDKANRNNASFYIVDPRGLPASDDLLGSPSVTADLNMLKTKLNQMRELAERTDGLAFADSNDLGKELARIVQDLSSYYLLGYDSTNGTLDGGYRSLSVKVKRPGVLLRARKGYRAAVLPAVGSSPSLTGGANPKNPGATDITSAVGAIMSTRADLPVRLRATAVRLLDTTTSNGPAPRASEMRIVAELDPKLALSDAWRQGGVARFMIKAEGSEATLSAEAALKPNERIVSAVIPLPTGFSMGEYRVQMRLNAQSHTDALSDSATVQVAAPGLIAMPTLLRRGPSTGTAYLATADVRFRRTDRLRLEAPSRLPSAQVKVTAVDQRGQPLNLPIQVTDRQDGAATLIVADVSLAPLAPGGYAVILAAAADAPGATTSADRVIVPFQLIP